MILKFPSGSNPTSPEVIAGLYFKDDGSWFLKTIEDISPDSLHVVEEFVKFISYTSNNDSIIRDFLDHQKRIESKDYDLWRRENLRLVEDDEENLD